MRRILVFALVLIGLMAPVALAQQLYTHDKVDYSFELPSAMWKSSPSSYPAVVKSNAMALQIGRAHV